MRYCSAEVCMKGWPLYRTMSFRRGNERGAWQQRKRGVVRRGHEHQSVCHRGC